MFIIILRYFCFQHRLISLLAVHKKLAVASFPGGLCGERRGGSKTGEIDGLKGCFALAQCSGLGSNRILSSYPIPNKLTRSRKKQRFTWKNRLYTVDTYIVI